MPESTDGISEQRMMQVKSKGQTTIFRRIALVPFLLGGAWFVGFLILGALGLFGDMDEPMTTTQILALSVPAVALYAVAGIFEILHRIHFGKQLKISQDLSAKKQAQSESQCGSDEAGEVAHIQLNEPDDGMRGISVMLVALRWDESPLSKEELRNRAAMAVQIVDPLFDKDVMDVKILEVNESQQYVQLSIRANFQDQDEQEKMREALKKEFAE